MRKDARDAERPLLYIAIAGITAPTTRVGHALAVGDWSIRTEGRHVRTHGYLMYVPGERHPDHSGAEYLPATVRQWKRLWMATDEEADPSSETPDCLRRQLAESIVPQCSTKRPGMAGRGGSTSSEVLKVNAGERGSSAVRPTRSCNHT